MSTFLLLLIYEGTQGLFVRIHFLLKDKGLRELIVI